MIDMIHGTVASDDVIEWSRPRDIFNKSAEAAKRAVPARSPVGQHATPWTTHYRAPTRKMVSERAHMTVAYEEDHIDVAV